MGLKAKIEAVIYAAEEPVTLAQLAGLFREEALESKHARAAAQGSAQGQPIADPVGAVPELPTLADGSAGREAGPESLPEADPEAGTVKPEQQQSSEAAQAAAPSPSADDERRRERLRDREAREELRRILDELIAEYSTGNRGMEIREIAGGYRVGTKPEYHDAVRSFVKSLKPPMKLSLQALETLAVVAYKQPITAPEVGEIRGVDSAGVLGSLMARKLIATAGRKQVIGRPILYKTTKEFLLRFGLRDVNELPSVEEFEKMAVDMEEQAIELPFIGEDAAPEERPHSISVSLETSADEMADLPGIDTPSGDHAETAHEI